MENDSSLTADELIIETILDPTQPYEAVISTCSQAIAACFKRGEPVSEVIWKVRVTCAQFESQVGIFILQEKLSSTYVEHFCNILVKSLDDQASALLACLIDQCDEIRLQSVVSAMCSGDATSALDQLMQYETCTFLFLWLFLFFADLMPRVETLPPYSENSVLLGYCGMLEACSWAQLNAHGTAHAAWTNSWQEGL